MYKNKKQTKPRIGGMWQKETKGGDTIFSISLNAEHLPEPDENGRIRLTALTNNYKETEQHPDFNLMEPKPQTGGGNTRGGFKGRSQPQRTTSKFQKRAPVQQEVSEDETDGDEAGEDSDESIPF